MSNPSDDDPILDDLDDPMVWFCGCGEFVDDSIHCPRCGGCPPWGCGMDHDDEDDDSADPFEYFDPYDGWEGEEP